MNGITLDKKNSVPQYGNRIALGDLVKVSRVGDGALQRGMNEGVCFRIIGLDNRLTEEYCQAKSLRGLTGIVVSDGVQEDSEDYGINQDGVYNVAIGGKIIRAFEDYFIKIWGDVE